MRNLRLPSPSMVVSVVALVVACSGGAVAATVITSKQIKNGTIQLGDISKSARQELRGKKGATGPTGLVGPRGIAGPTGPAGPAGAAGAAGKDGTGEAYATTNGADVTLTGTQDVAALTLPAGTWKVDAHIGGVNNNGAQPARLECALSEPGGSDSDFAKLRVAANDGTASALIFADENLHAVMSLPSGATPKVTCSAVGTGPNMTLTAHKLVATRVTSVVRQ